MNNLKSDFKNVIIVTGCKYLASYLSTNAQQKKKNKQAKKVQNLCNGHELCTNMCLKIHDFNLNEQKLPEQITLLADKKLLTLNQIIIQLQEQTRMHKLKNNRLYRQKRRRKMKTYFKNNAVIQIRKDIKQKTIKKYKPSVIGSQLNILFESKSPIKFSNMFRWQKEHTQWIQLILQDEREPRFHSITDLYDRFIQHHKILNQQLKQPLFYQFSKKYFNVTDKLPSTNKINNNIGELMLLRFVYSSTILDYKAEGTELIYLDETQIGKKIIPSKFWQLKAQVTQQMTSNLTNHAQYQKQQVIKAILRFKLQKVLQIKKQLVHDIKKRCSKKVVIILDNAPIHTADKVKKNELKDIPHEFLPPYNPLNSIQQSFTGVLLKKKFSKSTTFHYENFTKLFMKPSGLLAFKKQKIFVAMSINIQRKES